MNTVFLLPLALTILCNVEEIPFWIDSFGTGAVEFWRHASQRGLENDELHDLMGSIQERRFDERDLNKCKEAWQAKGVDFVKFLRELVEDDVLPDGKDDNRGFSQIDILEILALEDDTAVRKWIVSHARESLTCRLAVPIRSRDDEFYVRGLLRVLGKTKRNEALDLLVKVQSECFWSGEGAPRIDMEPLLGGKITSEEENGRVLRAIREEAIQAIAESGTERAVEILGTREGIAPDLHQMVDLDEYFSVAVRRHVGLHEFIPRERYGVELPAEKLAEIKNIYARYGKIYKPVKQDPDPWLEPYPPPRR
jgi:hypothetical protein